MFIKKLLFSFFLSITCIHTYSMEHTISAQEHHNQLMQHAQANDANKFYTLTKNNHPYNSNELLLIRMTFQQSSYKPYGYQPGTRDQNYITMAFEQLQKQHTWSTLDAYKGLTPTYYDFDRTARYTVNSDIAFKALQDNMLPCEVKKYILQILIANKAHLDLTDNNGKSLLNIAEQLNATTTLYQKLSENSKDHRIIEFETDDAYQELASLVDFQKTVISTRQYQEIVNLLKDYLSYKRKRTENLATHIVQPATKKAKIERPPLILFLKIDNQPKVKTLPTFILELEISSSEDNIKDEAPQ